MDSFINPPELPRGAEEEEGRRGEEAEAPVPRAAAARRASQFLIEHAPLEHWQRDVLEIVRDEAYYFAPQAMTKIMNEGWASYWHSRILTEKALTAAEVIDYADANSGVLATSPGRLNPYKLGVELFRNIEERWNKGQFGKEWDECDSMDSKRNWDRRTGPRAQEDLRGPQALQRHHVHRRVLHARVLRRAEVLLVRLPRAHAATGRS